MKSRALFLVPCSSSSQEPAAAAAAAAAAEDGPHGGEELRGNDSIFTASSSSPANRREGAIASRRLLVNKKVKKRSVIVSKPKRAAAGASSSSSASSSCSNAGPSRTRGKQRGPCRGNGDGAGRLQDLALPLGMSFAAIVSQVLDGIDGSRGHISVDKLSLICTSAVKESISNIYGDKFEHFLLNFEKSFGSTLRTLRLINEASGAGHKNRSSQLPTDEQRNRRVSRPSVVEQGNNNCSSCLHSDICEVENEACESFNASTEKSEDISPLMAMGNQIVLHGQMDRQLVSNSHSFTGPGFSQSILSTFEKSVTEQTRSNDLKAFEISLISRKLQLKESQLALSSCANMLEKIKISMGVAKASFKEEKLRNQLLDTRHAEFLRRCIDLLVAGLIIMSGCLGYGTYVYSYQRISEATSSCSAIPKESKSWFIPKQMASFSSGWLMLRCHVVSWSRMFFGLAMILAIGYSIFQRSSVSTPTTMPVTFILLLGILCGIAGKLCVDTLGGSGFYWILHWEAFCLIHFLGNVFPAALYRLLYGPILMSQNKAEGKLVPYWLRRFLFNSILSIFYPAMIGLLPFAPLGEWKGHFAEKINGLIIGIGNQQ